MKKKKEKKKDPTCHGATKPECHNYRARPPTPKIIIFPLGSLVWCMLVMG